MASSLPYCLYMQTIGQRQARPSRFCSRDEAGAATGGSAGGGAVRLAAGGSAGDGAVRLATGGSGLGGLGGDAAGQRDAVAPGAVRGDLPGVREGTVHRGVEQLEAAVFVGG